MHAALTASVPLVRSSWEVWAPGSMTARKTLLVAHDGIS